MIYQVPQFINKEVKIMGVITFTQLWLLLFAIGFIAFLFFVLPHWLFIILALFLAPAGALISLGKTNGIPLYKVILAAIRHFWLPKYYLWKKNRTSAMVSPKNLKDESNPSLTVKQNNPNQKKLSSETLEKLTNTLDQ